MGGSGIFTLFLASGRWWGPNSPICVAFVMSFSWPSSIHCDLYAQKRSVSILLFQGRSQELEMGGAKLLGEGSGGRLRPKGGCTTRQASADSYLITHVVYGICRGLPSGGCTCTCGPPPATAMNNTTRLFLLYQ